VKLKQREIFAAWLDERIAENTAKEQRLCAESRADEAIFVHMETNIYRVFKTAFAAGIRSCGDDEEALGVFFRQKLILIPASWHESVVKAVQCGDLEAAHVETRKLAAADEVKTAFYRIWSAEE